MASDSATRGSNDGVLDTDSAPFMRIPGQFAPNRERSETTLGVVREGAASHSPFRNLLNPADYATGTAGLTEAPAVYVQNEEQGHDHEIERQEAADDSEKQPVISNIHTVISSASVARVHLRSWYPCAIRGCHNSAKRMRA